MNPVQQHVSSSDKLHFAALEQAIVNSQAREAKTEERIEMPLNSFLKLERFMTEQQPPPTPPKISPIDIIPIQPSPIGWPPLPASPTEYDGDCPEAWPFSLCVRPIYNSFPSN